MKKLIPALAMLLVSAVLLGTSTFAWFSMNNKVTVTGMAVNTKVNSNLFVAETTPDAAASVAEANFGPATHFSAAATLLEPASTIDGKAFYYTNSATNVKADGSVRSASYTLYDEADTTGFTDANGVTGSKAFIDYAIELKAVNSKSTAANIKLTKLDLVYNGLPTAEKAFRVAVFTQKAASNAYTAVGTATYPAATSIFMPTGADYFTDNKAVKTASTVDTVLTPNTAVTLSVAANATEYYKVIFRIWLEGEDETCKNDTFAALTNNWVLDVAFEFDTETAGAALLGTSGVAAAAASSVGTVTLTAGNLSNGEVPTAFQWYDAATKAAVVGGTGATTYEYTAAAAGVYYCQITTAKGNVYYTPGLSLTAP